MTAPDTQSSQDESTAHPEETEKSGLLETDPCSVLWWDICMLNSPTRVIRL